MYAIDGTGHRHLRDIALEEAKAANVSIVKMLLDLLGGAKAM